MARRVILATQITYVKQHSMSTREFFQQLKPWSERKHRLLRKYLPPFIAKVARATRDREIYCVDGHVENNLPLFSDEASLSNVKKDRRATLRVAVELYLDRNPVVTRAKIRGDMVPRNFGYCHSKEYNAVVQELLADGILNEASGKKRINDTDILQYFPNR